MDISLNRFIVLLVLYSKKEIAFPFLVSELKRLKYDIDRNSLHQIIHEFKQKEYITSIERGAYQITKKGEGFAEASSKPIQKIFDDYPELFRIQKKFKKN